MSNPFTDLKTSRNDETISLLFVCTNFSLQMGALIRNKKKQDLLGQVSRLQKREEQIPPLE
jgi:hypothetical protein